MIGNKCTKGKMTDRTIVLYSMTVRDLFLMGGIVMIAMFLCELLINMLIRMQRLKQHCEQYGKRHQKID